MAMYPNQNTIIIHRNQVKKNTGKENLYLTAYHSSLAEAMKTLSGATFKVYIYLLFNADKFVLDFSPAHVAEMTGISTDSARDALRKLKDNGYLFKKEGKENRYDFYEVPREPQYQLSRGNDYKTSSIKSEPILKEVIVSIKEPERKREYLDFDFLDDLS